MALRSHDREDLVRPATSDEVRVLRLELGVTQTEFARFLGVSLPSVTRWEAGACKIGEMSRVLMEAMRRAMAEVGIERVSELVIGRGRSHVEAIRDLLCVGYGLPDGIHGGLGRARD